MPLSSNSIPPTAPTVLESADVNLLNREVAMLRAENERMRKALEEFGEHYGSCPARLEDRPCDCGLDAALAKPEAQAQERRIGECDCPCHTGGACTRYPTCCPVPSIDAATKEATK